MIAALDAEKKILLKLIERDVMTHQALDTFLIESALSGMPPVEMLLAKDLLSEADAAQAYAELNGLRYLDLARRHPSVGWVLSLPENVARRKQCLVFGEMSQQLVVAVADPIDASVRTELLEHYDRPLQFVVSPRFQIVALQNEIYGEARGKGARHVEKAPTTHVTEQVTATGLNMVEQLDSIIDEAVDRRASDIHIEPEQDRVRVRLRIDGRLIEARAYPIEAAAAMISRIKVLSVLDITERRKPQDGRFTQKSFDQNIDVRVAVIPTVDGERITMRLLNMGHMQGTNPKLGMEIEMKQAFERMIERPDGIILICGPTGSGKSTTMYAALQQINSVHRHIITIEDPVEYHIPGVNQVQVDAEFGVTFPSALRSILRHDPDVIMVGEIRDHETAHLALEASLTGHLVFATIHTNSAAGALTRLLDMGCEPYLVSSAIICVAAQRLVRRICENCKIAFKANAEERKLLGVPIERESVEIYRGTGCTRCGRSGYYDRSGIFELLTFDSVMAELVMKKGATEEMHAHALRSGTATLRQDAMKKVLRGLTTLEEAMRVTAADI